MHVFRGFSPFGAFLWLISGRCRGEGLRPAGNLTAIYASHLTNIPNAVEYSGLRGGVNWDTCCRLAINELIYCCWHATDPTWSGILPRRHRDVGSVPPIPLHGDLQRLPDWAPRRLLDTVLVVLRALPGVVSHGHRQLRQLDEAARRVHPAFADLLPQHPAQAQA